MKNDLNFKLEWDEETLELIARMRVRAEVDCILYGHEWRDDVPGIDGTVCVRCAIMKSEFENG